MRVHTVEYWENKLQVEEKNANKSNIRCKYPQNDEDLSNYKIAEFFVSINSNKTKLVA